SLRWYGFSVVGSGGVRLSQRQARRQVARARMVIPTDLWRASRLSFLAPGGRSSARLASVTCTMMSATISQCSSWATAPQRCVLFRRAMSAKLMRMKVSWKLLLPAALLVGVLSGCALRPQAAAPAAVLPQTPAPHEGTPYDI